MNKVLPGVVFLACALAAQANSTAIDDARIAAVGFVALVDEREYEKSYATASSVMRKEVSQEDWVVHLSSLREPLGQLDKRTEDLSVFHESLPDAPPGEYVIFTFDSSFENNNSATEVVAVATESDGVWRVVGYYFE